MLVTKTPLRISFFGGGSDIPEYWEHGNGLCVSVTINKHIYLAVNRCKTDHIRAVYSEMEVVKDVDQLHHDRIRETLKMMKINSNIEICSFSDVPTKGTGLGSSSTFTVGLINALNLLSKRIIMDPVSLAESAAHIEIVKCGEPIGYQDQYAAAHGNLRSYRFTNYGVEVSRIDTRSTQKLQNNLLCFNTGINRAASSILKNQVEDLKSSINIDTTKSIVDMAEYSIKLLNNDKVDDFGALLHETWMLKKQLSCGVSNDRIDEMYEIATKAGALGGKILGAGGGGYLLVYVQEHNRRNVLEAMSNYEQFDITFDKQGSRVELDA